MTDKISIKERIRRSGPPTKPVTVYLGVDVGLIDEYEALQERLDKVVEEGGPGDSLEGSPERDRLTERMQEIRAQLDECALTFRLRALDGDEWQRLVDEHPPRRKTGTEEADPRDAQAVWNTSTFPRALLRAATVEPQLDDEDWRLLLGDESTRSKLTEPQITDAANAVARLSRFSISLPFS
ncbi:hypothetical protein [Micromonospora sp. C41]|uniref:hypothetical protein n=1 Tax=Micromonospora sp. C41 TaxID=2824878 RepID=UPI001B39B8DD|nr:hypothetical protein [Micromonospora sp. C41]MBQ1064470.1 hypothetical protein [Micromonospora sp. C41]